MTSCTVPQLNTRTWHWSQVDAGTGATVSGPALDGVTAAAVRLLGWQRDGTAIAVRYQDDTADAGAFDGSFSAVTAYKSVSDVDLLALGPRGGQRTLLRKPADTLTDIDVPRNAILDGRFGGQSAAPAFFPLPTWMWAVALTVLAMTAGTVWLIVRRRRYRVWSNP
jgi:hypothetical protein